MYAEADQIKQLVQDAKTILVLQADNPDGDSLGSALGLEHILGDMGKQVVMYCGVDSPGYLRYLAGWDRIEKELPSQFDLSIIVDASTTTLFEKLETINGFQALGSRPCIVLDHHATTDHPIAQATVTLNDPKRSSTGEVIFALATESGWPLSVLAQTNLMTAILGDTQGLSNQLTGAETYDVMAAMIRAGVDRPALEEARREFGKMPVESFRYKGKLHERTEFAYDGTIATVTIPHDEITTLSPLYNPAPLIQPDILQTSGVKVAIVFKTYNDGKMTAAIRSNSGAGIAGELAAHFGGGGHDYASGFKVTDGRPFAEIKAECIKYAAELLQQLESKDAS